jgi:metallo-beta-lactamase class B
MKSHHIIALVASGLLFASAANAQAPDGPMFKSPPADSPYRTEKVAPFKVIDNIYFIGTTQQNISWLITTPEGHMIIDTTFEKDVPTILENIRTLGFKQDDVKLILTLHAHSDHVAGHAAMQEATGGQILAPEADAVVIETGGKADPHSTPWTPAKVDRRIVDGEKITLGDRTLTAHLTPGHTKGCTSWTTTATEEGKQYNVIFMCGLRIDGDSLLDDPDYPNIATDLSNSVKTLESLPVDVYLGGHGYWFALGDKIARMKAGEGYKAWIDPEGYRKSINGWHHIFVDRLIKEAMAKSSIKR